MRDRGRNENGRGCGESELRNIEGHLAAAALDQQDLKQIAMAMCANGPIVHRRARCNPLDVNEVERLIVRRIAVKVEQRQRRGAVLTSHGPSISRSGRKANGEERIARHRLTTSSISPLAIRPFRFRPAYSRVRDKPAPDRFGPSAPLPPPRTPHCARPSPWSRWCGNPTRRQRMPEPERRSLM